MSWKGILIWLEMPTSTSVYRPVAQAPLSIICLEHISKFPRASKMPSTFALSSLWVMLISAEQISRFTKGPPKVLAPKLSPQWSEKKEHRPQVMQDIDNCLRIPTVPASVASDPPMRDLTSLEQVSTGMGSCEHLRAENHIIGMIGGDPSFSSWVLSASMDVLQTSQ